MYDQDIVLIPKERVAILIGSDGKTKKLIEKKSGAKLLIDSETGNVSIKRLEDTDPFFAWKLKDVVKAIGRGFNPEKALELLKEDTYFEIVDLHDFAGHSKKAVETLKSRIIGSSGKVKASIESESGATLSIYGKTAGIIGSFQSVETAKKAVELLAEGATHSSVYKKLREKRQKKEIAEKMNSFGI
ncbi:MAG: RNA-processing protein [Candidatus Diapherotrites archaeon]|nr:RNA-processing protein [Candidatus Diapherotrites archaeon]